MKKKIFISIFCLFVISFLIIYFIGHSSYYDYNASRRKQLTEEQIKEFETAIANGEKIDINDYYKEMDDDYDNMISDVSLKISSKIGKTFEKAISLIFDGLNDIFVKKS